MKSKIFTLSILIVAFLGLNFKSAKAQYVTIPDADFVTWLVNNYPSCMNGNMMDTTCSEVVNETYINVDNSGISDLTGVRYFDNLDSLSCFHNQITFIPSLPNNLIYLECSQNFQLSSLPQLPNTFEEFICVDCNLTSLQSLPNSLKKLVIAYNPLTQITNLPSSLLVLQCSNNLLTSLPTLPPLLNHMECYDNQITSLGVMPNSLVTLVCNENQLGNFSNLSNSLEYFDCGENLMTALPPLPNSLKHLVCYENQISILPPLPSSLIYLECSGNQIAIIPTLPDSITNFGCASNMISSLPTFPNSLKLINCSENLLTYIPTLPNHLIALYCGNNQLSSLPELPTTLEELHCNDNNITCYPTIPLSIYQYFNISNNPATCLPNYIAVMDSATLAIPLCHANDLINNPNNCNEAAGIFGTIYNDGNNNCTYNSNDVGTGNVQIKFFNSISNQFGSTFSANNGAYGYPTLAGQFMVLLDTLNKSYKVECMYPGIDTSITTSSPNLFVNNVNFAVSCKTGYDLGVQSVVPFGLVFPGQQHSVRVLGGDLSQWIGLNCATGVGGQLQITISGPVIYNGIALGALTPLVNGNIFTYNISNFGIINNQNAFKLYFLTDTLAQLGEEVCVHVEIVSDSLDINIENNVKDYCYAVFNSYDPNYKEVYPVNVEPGFEDWLTYTIHFQNTGNAPAINIRLVDTLDANLNMETFEVINYSHYNTVNLFNGVVDFRFPNILLPDSASDIAGSQGFAQYRIKPKANLIEGTQIKNRANIYFDFNAPITTNTTVNNFVTEVGLNDILKAQNIAIFPNPSNGIFNLSAQASFEVYNIVGELLLQSINTKTIDLSNNPNGIYFIKMNGISTKKLIKN